MNDLIDHPDLARPSSDGPNNPGRRRFGIGVLFTILGTAIGARIGEDRGRRHGEAFGRDAARAELLDAWDRANREALALAEDINRGAFNPNADPFVPGVEIYNGTAIVGRGVDPSGRAVWYGIENPVILARDPVTNQPLALGSLNRSTGTPQEPARWSVHTYTVQQLIQDRTRPASSTVTLGVDPLSVELSTVADQGTTQRVGVMGAYDSVG